MWISIPVVPGINDNKNLEDIVCNKNLNYFKENCDEKIRS